MILPVTEANLMDAATVHAISWQASHRTVCSPEFVASHTPQRQADYLQKELLKGKRLFLLMDPEPAGIVSVWGDLIENLYVLPEKQHRGCGKTLLHFAASLCVTPTLWVLSSNETACQWYLREGFTETGRRKELSGGLFEREMVQLSPDSCSPRIRRAVPADIPAIIALLQKRIDWMDEKGLYQWNKTHYLDCYPPAYFEEKILGETVLVARAGTDLTAVMALFSHDPRWAEDGITAYYVHHLATDPQYPGLGRAMLDYAETFARAHGRQALRLDSQLVNGKLSRYYEDLGYQPVGQCVDGEYVGILREKFL